MKRNETFSSKLNLDNDVIKDVYISTDIVSSLIHEYLLKSDYIKTLDSFQEEISYKIKQKNYYKIYFSNITDSNLMKFFNLGRKNEFFKIWKRIIPNHIRLREPPIQKLEFYIQVYFAIYPLLYRDSEVNCRKTIQETMEEFKDFLEKKDRDYSKSNEFLSFYALPYVKNPKTHPSYFKIFQPDWSVELKEKIYLSVKTYFPLIKYPVLFDLVNESNSNSNKENNNLNATNGSNKAYMVKNFFENEEQIEGNREENQIRSDENFAYLEEINRLKEENEMIKIKLEDKKHQIINLQKSWINMANQILTNSFDLVVLCKGNRNTNDILLKSNKIHKKLLRYQSFIKKHSNNLERFNRSSGINSTALSAIKEQSDEIFENMGPGFDDISGIGNNSLGNKSFGMENETTHLLDINNFQISFRDIFIKKENQNFFNTDNDLKYASIIREIRYRIFKRNDYQMRQLTLYSIFYYDLIYRFNLLKTVLEKKSDYPYFSLEIMKLMSRLSSLKKGRNYLLMNSNSMNMIENLFYHLKAEKQDTKLRQNLLVTLERFTPRLEAINKLIEIGIIKWLIDVFTYEINTLSDRTIAYGLAMLLNLSLNKNGINKFEEDSERTIQILINFFNQDNNEEVQTSVNSALYSLLRRKALKEAAKKFGLENIIQNIDTTKIYNPKQISYILQALNNEDKNKEITENTDEDPNVIDENEENKIIDDEDMDSFDEKMNKINYISDFIIRNDNQNEEEILKLKKFMQYNPNVLISDNKVNIENINKNDIMEEKNLNVEENKEGENKNNNGEKGQNKENNEQPKNGNEIYDQNIDDERGFEKRDRIKRTP